MSVVAGVTKERTSRELEVDNNGSLFSRRSSTANDHLAQLGYEPELNRSLSIWQVAFMSCVLAAVPYGVSTTLAYPLYGEGPADIIWSWVLICIIMVCGAASLGEITSVYPTAGGVYYQTSMISPPRYRRPLEYVCGRLEPLGNIISTLSMNMGTALFLVGCINIFRTSHLETVNEITMEIESGIFNLKTYMTYLIFLSITLSITCISAFGNKWLPLLDVSSLLSIH